MNLTHHFLIAMPGLEDKAFNRSVVYLCEHSERGALGLVINKPSDINLKVDGVQRLTLEVDFGKNQDVGDRVVWANARLLRSAGLTAAGR